MDGSSLPPTKPSEEEEKGERRGGVGKKLGDDGHGLESLCYQDRDILRWEGVRLVRSPLRTTRIREFLAELVCL